MPIVKQWAMYDSSNSYWWTQSRITLHSQELHYLSAVKLDRCAGSCKNLNDLSSRVCVPSKTEDLNLSVFNMITWIN